MSTIPVRIGNSVVPDRPLPWSFRALEFCCDCIAGLVWLTIPIGLTGSSASLDTGARAYGALRMTGLGVAGHSH